jgi:hypothetical protein
LILAVLHYGFGLPLIAFMIVMGLVIVQALIVGITAR